MKLAFATSNQHKLKEVLSIAPQGFEIVSLNEIGYEGEIPETQATIEGNSLQKAEFISTLFNIACFAEDTGLEVEALNGEPGVYSARYAGEHAGFQDNITKLLKNMKGEKNRKARFKTVITYYNEGKYVQFEGLAEGEISESIKGSEGFGYDPVFIPDGSAKSFAEMTLDEKNLFSHRKKSFDKFATYLTALYV